ncbi:MAG: response regulator [Deltaproteobacteria bacterium]|nr:response regulator [Deltaproteobacteria bacterium]
MEDDEALREAIALYLREKGCFVENFACVEDASSAGGLELYDAVISDYLLPGEDGLSFLRRVRETSKNVFTILITAFAAWDLSEDAMLAGVDIFIPKPFSALELDSALQRMAERRESEDGDLPLVNG